MIAVIFEVIPGEQTRQQYLDIAASLVPALRQIDGFLSIERFQSLSDPGKLLSLSFWRDEQAVAQWRNTEQHRCAQQEGRGGVFQDYRLRIATVVRDYGLVDREQAPADSRDAHEDAQASASMQAYLAKHYVTRAQLAGLCGVDEQTLTDLLAARLLPGPSYVVSELGTVRSYVFGELPAPGAVAGDYFHPTCVHWFERARHLIDSDGMTQAPAALQRQFISHFQAALIELNTSTWRLGDCVDDDGVAIAAGMAARADSAWVHFLNGTFGLCVADPVSEAAIARKEILQEKLSALSENGSKSLFSQPEIGPLRAVICAYAQSAMPFSPVDFPISSRKRLVDDLLARLRQH